MIFEGREVLLENTTNSTAIICMHGGLGNATNFKSRIDAHLPDVMKVYVNADDSNVWRAGGHFGDSTSDLLWLSGFIYHLQYNYSIDKVFLLGYSNGGAMAYRAVEKVPFSFDGLIAIAANYFEPVTDPVPVLHVHGFDDTVIPILGNEKYKPLTENLTALKVRESLLFSGGHDFDEIMAKIDLKPLVESFIQEVGNA